ncbi:MAG: hypothetical protein AAFQ15_01365 [Pseudomonadota bacterium]
MIFRTLFFAGVLMVAACETVPTTFDPVLFDAEVKQIAENPSTVSSEAAYTRLLERSDLTPEQRVEVTYQRATKRWDGKYDLPGAIEDFDAFLALAPEDPRVSTVGRDKVFAASEIENAQRRLAGLQNITDWFDDKVLMGDLEEGATRYKASGLTPTDLHLYMLREAGYICEGDDAPVHRYGDLPEYAQNASWCPAPAES